MQIGLTKWTNENPVAGESLIKDIDLNIKKTFLSFITEAKVVSIVSSQFPETKEIDLKINGFRNIRPETEGVSDIVATTVSVGVGVASKMLNSVSTVLVFSSDHVILIDRDTFGNPNHFSAHNVRALNLIETYKDYQSWDRSVFHFSDGKTVEFGAPNAIGLGGSPNKKIVQYLKEHKIIA